MGLTGWLPGNPLIPARILSFIAIVTLLVLVVRQLSATCATQTERLILAVTVIGAPGTLLIAGMGYGVALAMLLFLLGMLLGLREESIQVRTAALAGLLLGLAIATRWTLIPAMPAILLWALHSQMYRRDNFIGVLVAGGIAAGVFLLMMWGQAQVIALGSGTPGDTYLENNLNAAGVGETGRSPARLLSFFVKLATVLPVSLLVVAVAAYVIHRKNAHQRRVIIVLLGAALLILFSWMLMSPTMHLRYVWPVYMLIAICAGLGFTGLFREAQKRGNTELMHIIVAVPALLAASQLVIALRLIAMGTAMQINNAGYENIENHFTPFYHISEQRQIVRYLTSREPEINIAALYLPGELSALELSFLSKRPVTDILVTVGDKPARMDVSQKDLLLVHKFSPISAPGRAWIETLGKPLEKIGGYSVYSLAEAPPPPSAEVFIITSDLYRFGPARWLSLTGY